jgi:hypothetical protein
MTLRDHSETGDEAQRAVSPARQVIDKYGADADKPSVHLAKALLAGAHERDRLRKENDPLSLLAVQDSSARNYLREHWISETATLTIRATTAEAERDGLRVECERMRPVYEAALAWRREIIGERASYDLRLESSIDHAISTAKGQSDE